MSELYEKLKTHSWRQLSVSGQYIQTTTE